MGMVIYLRRASVADIKVLTADPARVDAFVFEEGDPETDLVEFDKAWHALHFILTGEAYGSGHPLGIIAGDAPKIESAESGFGEFWVLSPDSIAEFAAALEKIDDRTLAARIDIDAMVAVDIYIADAFAEDDKAEAIEYIMQGVPALRRFAASCREAGDGALRVIA